MPDVPVIYGRDYSLDDAPGDDVLVKSSRASGHAFRAARGIPEPMHREHVPSRQDRSAEYAKRNRKRRRERGHSRHSEL